MASTQLPGGWDEKPQVPGNPEGLTERGLAGPKSSGFFPWLEVNTYTSTKKVQLLLKDQRTDLSPSVQSMPWVSPSWYNTQAVSLNYCPPWSKEAGERAGERQTNQSLLVGGGEGGGGGT